MLHVFTTKHTEVSAPISTKSNKNQLNFTTYISLILKKYWAHQYTALWRRLVLLC